MNSLAIKHHLFLLNMKNCDLIFCQQSYITGFQTFTQKFPHSKTKKKSKLSEQSICESASLKQSNYSLFHTKMTFYNNNNNLSPADMTIYRLHIPINTQICNLSSSAYWHVLPVSVMKQEKWQGILLNHINRLWSPSCLFNYQLQGLI